MSNAFIRVGTASWSEPEFVKAEWYPKGLPAAQQLPFYAERFDMVELNSSFYAIPQARMCDRWTKVTPDGFLFNVKCHRLLSRHATKADALAADLRHEAEATDRGNVILTPELEHEVAARFLDELKPLEQAGKLGALLLQMTPGFAPRTADLTALEPLFRQLKGSGKKPTPGRARTPALRLARRPASGEDHGLFTRAGGDARQHRRPPRRTQNTFTIMPAVDEITDGRLAYLRLHGRDAKAYLTGKTVAERFHYNYSDAELNGITERAQHLAREADEVHVVFNNNSRDFAPRAAERLRHKLGQPSKSVGRLKQTNLL